MTRAAAGRSPLAGALLTFAARPGARAAGLFLILMIAAAAASSIAAPGAAAAQNLQLGASAPSWAHPFGTDHLGRDVLLRILDGARISLAVAAAATAVSLAIGVPYGAAAGYLGGRADSVMMRFVDILYGLPSILFVLLLLAWFARDPAWSLPLLFAGLGAIAWLTPARIVRAQILSLREREFVAAARLAGAGTARIIYKHLAPQTAGPVLAFATLTMPRVMIEEAFLSFLGLGVSAPRASWGTLLSDGVQSLREHPWLVIFPSLTFAAALAAFYALGDALRDAFDPRGGGTQR